MSQTASASSASERASERGSESAWLLRGLELISHTRARAHILSPEATALNVAVLESNQNRERRGIEVTREDLKASARVVHAETTAESDIVKPVGRTCNVASHTQREHDRLIPQQDCCTQHFVGGKPASAYD